MDNPLADDLRHVLAHTREVWPQFRGARLLITGGTGFFGTWLLESLVETNRQLNLGVEAWVLTRDPEAFSKKHPRLASQGCLHFHRGDVRDFAFPDGDFPWVIHAATPASARLNQEKPLEMLDIVVQGTRHVLDLAVQRGCRKFLLTSSGAIYGRQPPTLTHMPEDYAGSPDPAAPTSAYGEGKRLAELLGVTYAQRHGIELKIARCFAFVGPHLPLDQHYAIGNFIRDALAGGPIKVQGDGTPLRSYLYAADLAIWLWKIFALGASCRPYNVGSDESIDILSLAQLVGKISGRNIPVAVASKAAPGRAAERYVPLTARAREELGLEAWTALPDAIRKTLAFYQA